jgi:hypothetical protein
VVLVPPSADEEEALVGPDLEDPGSAASAATDAPAAEASLDGTDPESSETAD